MPEWLHGHQISNAWLHLLLHRSLFWNCITKFNLIFHKCPPLLDHQFPNIMRGRQGDHFYICSVVNPPWTRPCWDTVFAQQPHTCGFVSISRKVTLLAQGSYTRTHHNGLAAQQARGCKELNISLSDCGLPIRASIFVFFQLTLIHLCPWGLPPQPLGRWPSWCTHNGWHTVLGTSVCLGWDLLVQESPQNLVNGIFRSIKNKRLWGIIVAFHWIKKFA